MDSRKTENFIVLADEQVENGDLLCAIEHYKKHLEQNPQDTFLYNRIGYLYGKIHEINYLDEQINYFQKALKINSNDTIAIRNLAFAYQLVGKYNKSIDCFKKLFELGPVEDDYFAYSCLKIMMRDFEEGWKYYESRFLKEFGATYYPKFEKPKWEGQEIKGKTLLVHFEQGFGDSIQFFRYLEQVKPLVGKIIFKVQNELVSLFKANSSDIEIVRASIPIKELSPQLNFDYHVPLMSLPYLLNARFDNIPMGKGYLSADEDKIQKFKKRFFDNGNFKIGISWCGLRAGNHRRNVPLECFYPLARLKNVSVYSFQKGFGSEQLEKVPSDLEIINLGREFSDFSDTAAAMANLDLFVTGDNAVFNLVGAMGKKTFLMLNKNSEWRWFFDDEITPWYDSVKIFKKKHENDSWDSVMERIIEEVEKINAV